jgi:hypothetical protein
VNFLVGFDGFDGDDGDDGRVAALFSLLFSLLCDFDK